MTTWNKAITKEEATELLNANDGANYPNTEHNKVMMKGVVDEFLLTLRDAK
jgi:hypothetical protein